VWEHLDGSEEKVQSQCRKMGIIYGWDSYGWEGCKVGSEGRELGRRKAGYGKLGVVINVASYI